MQIIKSISILFSFVILLASCSTGASSSANDPLLKEAFNYHNEAMEVEKALVTIMEQLRIKKNEIQIQGRELTEKEMDFIDDANQMEFIYEKWKMERIEVPGFEHDHSHEGHEHHNHGADLQLTSQQMMEIQKESLQHIIGFNAKAAKIIEK